MHWSEEIAREIIAREPDREVYTCAAGISPSGSVHIGNFRDIATSYFVCEALKRLGKNSRLIFSWDDYDRLRKVPSNVAKIAPDFEKYIGMPYAEIPDPFGTASSYAEHFEKEFEASLEKLGIKPEIIYQNKEYKSGRYSDDIIYSLKNRKELYDIIQSFKTQEASDKERENYYPVSVYCSKCGKDTTTVISASDDCESITYKCSECGNEETVNLREYTRVKLMWKVDWPMRWRQEGVVFEPGGIDHAAASGSFVVATDVAKKVFDYTAPVFRGYGWLEIKGCGSMHSSTGNNITPENIMKVYEPEMVRWLFAKYVPADPFAFEFGDTIIRHYSEFDKQLVKYYNHELSEGEETTFDLCLMSDRSRPSAAFGVLSGVAPVVDFKPEAVKELLAKVGVDFDADGESRLERVKYWLNVYQPDKIYKLLEEPNYEYYVTLDDEKKNMVKQLCEYIKTTDGFSQTDVQQFLYSVINDPNCTKKENVARQSECFKVLYNVMFGKDAGPRLYLFLAAIDKNSYISLLDFDEAKAAEYLAAKAAQAEESEPEAETESTFEPAPFKDEVEYDDFSKLDLRICEIRACDEIKKSRNCLKLTLFDGVGERVIVSSIKGIYTPEELVGKKIIVLTNLKPAKFSGVTSNGMLLAGENTKGECRVIFLDDAMQTGVQIS